MRAGQPVAWAGVQECPPKDGPALGLLPRCSRATGPRASQLGRRRGSKAVTAHDLPKLFDVRRAVSGEHVGDIFEVARAQQTRADDGKEAGVNVAVVTEPVDHAARYEERLSRVQFGSPPADGKRSDAVQPENGFVELVVAVRRRH